MYVYNRGDGHDTIDNGTSYHNDTGTDRLKFGEGLEQGSVAILKDGADLVFGLKDGSGSSATSWRRRGWIWGCLRP